MTAPTLPLAQREGFHAPGIEIFEWPDIVHLEVAGVDLSINRVVLQMFLVALLVWGLFYFAFRRPKLVPSGLQNVMEAVVDFVRNQIVLEVIGRDGLRYALPDDPVRVRVLRQPGRRHPADSLPAERPHGHAHHHGHLQPAPVHQRRDRQPGFGPYFKERAVPPGIPGRSTSC